MTEAATRSPAVAPGETGWAIRPARTEDVPAVADAVTALLAELGGSPPPRAALEAEASAHVADPSLGLVLVAEASGAQMSSQKTSDSEGNCERAGTAGLVGVLTASWARAIQVAGRC